MTMCRSAKMNAAEEKVKAKKIHNVLDDLKELLKDAGFDTGDEDEAE